MRPPSFLTGSLLSLFAMCSLTAITVAHAQVAQAQVAQTQVPQTQVAQAVGAEQMWLWPVDGEKSIRLEYQAPVTEYGRGHRGIDLPVDAGQEVRAPATGIVTYAGSLAGRGVLSLRVGEYLVSFEPLTASVGEGEVVVRGQVIGTVGTGSHCDECLHVGVRRTGLYLSPMKLLGSLPRASLELWDDAHWASVPSE